jgi:phenylacetate-CoA ligase
MPPKIPKTTKEVTKMLKDLGSKPEQFWIKRGEKMALNLFHEMADRVPAYKDHLKKNKINPKKIKTIEDFKNFVPIIDKDNYLRKYPLEQLCWDGELSKGQYEFSSTSGSTGAPFYFPRTDYQNEQYALSAEMYLRTNFEIHKKSTLYINCFALGVWIGGIFTYEAIKIIANRGKYNLTIINPGLNRPEIFKAIKNLGQKYDQVLIGGYPPFIKDVIDEGEIQGVDWKKYNLGIIFSAEAFSEDFRDYIAEKAGLKNIYKSTLNHYGIVDLGTTSEETPVSIYIRRECLKNKDLYSKVFAQDPSRLPTLVQYIPELFYFEEINSGLICSSASGLPLVRYDLKDFGGVISFDKVFNVFKKLGRNLNGELKKAIIQKSTRKTPFAYVYERKDMSVSLAGANIYPESIRKVLIRSIWSRLFTGKFNLQTKNDLKFNQYLEINIELKKDALAPKDEEKELLVKELVNQLLSENSEFRSVFFDQKQGGVVPRVNFWAYGHPEFFNGGGKHKWVTK